jgi:hypothetical protein
VDFQQYLDSNSILRVRFDLEQGKVLRFAIQLECLFGEKWVAVVRYDTAHGFAHCDRLHPYEEATKIEMPTQDYNEALTVAMEDLIANWQSYRRRYELWLRRK